jgi:hypothetical protein
MNITIKNVPVLLHQRLREAAEASGRSLNKLVLFTLEREFCAHKAERSALMERIRQRREKMSLRIDAQSLERAIEDGRL